MQRHAVSITPKNCEFGACSEAQKLSIFERRIDSKLKKPEEFFFPEENKGNYQSRNLSNQ